MLTHAVGVYTPSGAPPTRVRSAWVCLGRHILRARSRHHEKRQQSVGNRSNHDATIQTPSLSLLGAYPHRPSPIRVAPHRPQPYEGGQVRVLHGIVLAHLGMSEQIRKTYIFHCSVISIAHFARSKRIGRTACSLNAHVHTLHIVLSLKQHRACAVYRRLKHCTRGTLYEIMQYIVTFNCILHHGRAPDYLGNVVVVVASTFQLNIHKYRPFHPHDHLPKNAHTKPTPWKATNRVPPSPPDRLWRPINAKKDIHILRGAHARNTETHAAWLPHPVHEGTYSKPQQCLNSLGILRLERRHCALLVIVTGCTRCLRTRSATRASETISSSDSYADPIPVDLAQS